MDSWPEYSSADAIAVVADDDEGDRNSVGECLETVGCKVKTVQDGVELVEKLQELQQTGKLRSLLMVVTDMDMPRRNGLAALEIIRRRFPNVRVIVVSAFADAVVRARAFALGAAAVLSKPFDYRKLTDLAEGYMNSTRVLRWY